MESYPPSEIWRCGLSPTALFDKPCPLSWEKLKPTESPTMRHCETCNRNVYEVSTPEEFVERAKARECVSLQVILTHEVSRHEMLGEPLPWNWNLEADARQWWQQVRDGSPSELDRVLMKENRLRETRSCVAAKIARGEDFA